MNTTNPRTYPTATCQPWRTHWLTFLASVKMFDTATPALEPNQIIEPPNPTAYASRPQSYPPCFSARAVSGMLSKTEDRKPRPRVVIAEAAGSFSTGIIEAQVTSASRKMEPLKAPGRSFQSGWRMAAAVRRATQTAVPITGKWSRTSLKYRLATTFATIAAIRIQNTIASRAQSTCTDSAESFMIGWKACCCLAAKY